MVARESAADDNVLVYAGQRWDVESEPTVVESDGESVLVEVWVKRGEGGGQPQ
ncbi:hypothetical protein [Streptomyces fractus]|uniref:hypothetical protein n=1 Tax=Streptomyces fractus TaxID=641806 RepID=UPI003CE9F986